MYKEQLDDMQNSFGTMLRQLPGRTEMPSLLQDISQAAQVDGLKQDLFRPGNEATKDFYAEKPIDPAGRRLPRVRQVRERRGGAAAHRHAAQHRHQARSGSGTGTNLTMTLTAKTYRYLEDDEQDVDRKPNRRRSGASHGQHALSFAPACSRWTTYDRAHRARGTLAGCGTAWATCAVHQPSEGPQGRPYRAAAADQAVRDLHLRRPGIPLALHAAAQTLANPEVARSTSGLHPDFNRNREYLEQFPLDGLKMVGTLTLNGAMFALVRDGDNVLHRVTVGNYMGQNYGKIISITDSDIKLREMVPDGQGGWSERVTTVKLAADCEVRQHMNRIHTLFRTGMRRSLLTSWLLLLALLATQTTFAVNGAEDSNQLQTITATKLPGDRVQLR